MSFFNQAAIDAAIKEQEEFQESRGKEIIPIGLNMLSLLKVELEHSKSSQPMIVIEYQKERDKEKYKTMKEYFYFGSDAALDKNGVAISAKQLISRMHSAFGYTFKPTDDLAEIALQIAKFEGVKFRAVIKHEKKLNKSLVEFLSPAISFCGLEKDENINQKSYDPAKLVIPLSEYDRQRLAGVATRSAKSAPKASSAPSGGSAPSNSMGDAPDISDDDELPF